MPTPRALVAALPPWGANSGAADRTHFTTGTTHSCTRPGATPNTYGTSRTATGRSGPAVSRASLTCSIRLRTYGCFAARPHSGCTRSKYV